MNPKENGNAITLRGDKQLDGMPKKVIEASNEESQKRDLPEVIDKATSLIEAREPPKKMLRIESQQLFWLCHSQAALPNQRRKRMRRRS